MLRKEEYVINDFDDPKTQIKKSMKRQRNLMNMLAKSAVCVVADPLVVSLDGLPSLDILHYDFKRKQENKNQSYQNEFKTQYNLRSVSRPKLNMLFNKISQTN